MQLVLTECKATEKGIQLQCSMKVGQGDLINLTKNAIWKRKFCDLVFDYFVRRRALPHEKVTLEQKMSAKVLKT